VDRTLVVVDYKSPVEAAVDSPVGVDKSLAVVDYKSPVEAAVDSPVGVDRTLAVVGYKSPLEAAVDNFQLVQDIAFEDYRVVGKLTYLVYFQVVVTRNSPSFS
jgi:hypothetical protein